MNTQNEDRNDNVNSAYNPFPEPQTIPSGWDFAAITSRPEEDSVLDEDNESDR